ncbi:metal-dependent hydrolase [Sedimentibacter sp. zth1]|uniref:metal-dependent hydrolase n=1 Tax=Sedimentibacter sp. zth1 TaxID=2816908 RepID=UPI001A929605|nr:metal-dependent hydrolase [Sedimentibacter sp. zth1]QSX05570.1 metal-dependent hydrolase [Sedimentibacter sp. zth1]
MKIQYLGHSVFIIKNDSFKCIIDPYITNNPFYTGLLDDIKGLTHIFITHGHGDHIGDCVELAKKNNALVITNAEISSYLNNKGVHTHAMHIGGRYKFDFGTVKLTVALHGSSINDNGNIIDGGNPCGFLLKIDGKTIYHAGDTGLTMDMQLLKDEKIDVAMLPIGGNYTMDIRDAVKAVEFIKPKNVIPMHYDTFDVINANPNEFKNLNKSCTTTILNYGENIEI